MYMELFRTKRSLFFLQFPKIFILKILSHSIKISSKSSKISNLFFSDTLLTLILSLKSFIEQQTQYFYSNMSGVFKNRLKKIQSHYRQGKHLSHLDQIASSQQTDYAQKSYRRLFEENAKKTYLNGIRKSEIDLENKILKDKIAKIKVSPKSKAYWLKDRSHSLNEVVRKKSLRSIDEENQRLLLKLTTQKPAISYSKIMKVSYEQAKRAENISLMEKYRLPEIQDRVSIRGKRSNSSLEFSDISESQRYKNIRLNLSLKDAWKNFMPQKQSEPKNEPKESSKVSDKE